MYLEDTEAVPNDPLKILSRTFHEELVGFILKSLFMDESLPHQNCVAHSLFGHRYHLMVEHNSLIFLKLDIFVKSQENLCLQSKLRTFLESINYKPVFDLFVSIEAECHDDFLRKSIIPHQNSTFLEDSLTLEIMESFFPGVEDSFRLDFDGIFSLNFVEMSFVQVFD